MIRLEKNNDYERLKEIIESNSMNSFWQDVADEIKENSYNNSLYFVLNEKDTEVGIVEVKNSEDSLNIEMIEIINKYSSIGTKAIKCLFNEYKDVNIITGESLPESIPFWYKIGANFNCSEDECLSLDDLLEYDTTLYFELSKARFNELCKI